MIKEAMFTLKLEPDLRDAFMAEAEAAHRPASQLVREFMRDFVKRQREARERDAWVRAEIEQVMRATEEASLPRPAHKEVFANWRRRRAELLKRGGRAPE